MKVDSPTSPVVSVLMKLPPDELSALQAKCDRQLELARHRVVFLEFQETQLAAAMELQQKQSK